MDLSKVPNEHRKILEELKKRIVAIDSENAKAAARKVIVEKIDPMLAIRYSIADAAKIVGEKFDTGECYLPHLVMVGDLMDEIGVILEEAIPKEQQVKKNVVVIGAVQGDMHSVGKNLVATMLRAGGFEVHDLGVDVPSAAFISKAQEVKADMIALSSLLTTTMPYQREVIDDLVSMGLRDSFKVMIGGGPVTPQYAEEIGADAYGKDAIDGVFAAKQLFGME